MPNLIQKIIQDIFLLGSIGCLGYGLYQVYPPAMFIGYGVLGLAYFARPTKKGDAE